jgi:hypothetical protein
MPLYNASPTVSALELKVRVREQYGKVIRLDQDTPEGAQRLLDMGPRSVDYAEGRSITAQMSGCNSQDARLQMAYTMLAVGRVLLELRAKDEVSS